VSEQGGATMAILCFGGSFNPIHHGHLICSRAVAEAGGYAKVLLIPSKQPPHKPDAANLAAAEDRLAMCRLAVQGDHRFEVSDLEMKRTGPSYTIDTIRQLRASGPVHWLVGADMLLDLPRWHLYPQLLDEARFVVMARPGWTIDWKSLPAELAVLEANVIEAPPVDLSATDIRHRMAAGLPIDYFTPPAVVRYIHDRGLYRT